jgi:hypothetical protein
VRGCTWQNLPLMVHFSVHDGIRFLRTWEDCGKDLYMRINLVSNASIVYEV